MKKELPNDAKISKEAKDCMKEILQEFIGFVTDEAIEICSKDDRATMNGDDILRGMATNGFNEYLRPLSEYLKKHREAPRDKRYT